MSYKIKPEDVPDNLLDACFLHAMGEGPSQRWSISEILNAAIEAGLVSPPCYTVRNLVTGQLFYDVGQVQLRPGKPEIPAHEHWKGQTE